MTTKYLSYLRRIIAIAAVMKGSSTMLEVIGEIRCAKAPIYQLMRDIVCDARFYSVVESDLFWKNYTCAVISRFVDSLTKHDWEDESLRTLKKEDFLNDWLLRHILPLTSEERNKIAAEMNMNGMSDASGGTDMEYSVRDGERDMGNGIIDMTATNGEIGKGLPPKVMKFAKMAAGANDRGAQGCPHMAEAEFLERIDSSLYALARLIGRRGSESHSSTHKFQAASRSDISGVLTGDNLNSLLPAELALLAEPATENVFLHRFVQKRLQIFSSASDSVSAGKNHAGPVFICIDTSGSMTGRPERIAKTLALAISIIAQRAKRPICMVNYSHNLSFFILTNLARQREQFLSFLSNSYGGGNDENKLFRFLFEILPKTPRYSQFANAFKGADLLVVSDFIWSRIDAEVKRMIDRARQDGMNTYALMVNPRDMNEEYEEYEENGCYNSGFHFYSDCDYKYLTDNNRVFTYPDN